MVIYNYYGWNSPAHFSHSLINIEQDSDLNVNFVYTLSWAAQSEMQLRLSSLYVAFVSIEIAWAKTNEQEFEYTIVHIYVNFQHKIKPNVEAGKTIQWTAKQTKHIRKNRA